MFFVAMPSPMRDLAIPFLVNRQLCLNTPFVLAPLAGYTDLPFRLLCREQGAALVFTEMVSSHGLQQAQRKTLAMLNSVAAERPVIVQLFGADPEVMAAAAAKVCTLPVDGIDLNMGCPVRKVVKRGAGVALMRSSDTARAIIRAVCAASFLPVSVKFRSGWNAEQINAVAFAQMAEEAGAALLTVHGRTWTQAFGGRADWQVVAAVKQAVGVPVIGNGDIGSHADGCQRLAASGCDAVMVGRGALGNPWLFAGRERPHNLAERLPLLHRYLELCERHLVVERVLFRIKCQVNRLLSGLPGAAQFRQQVLACPSTADIRRCLDSLCC